MGKRATIADLAREAGVSVATVDRVLNQRLPVREDTALRVVAAAESIGYKDTPILPGQPWHVHDPDRPLRGVDETSRVLALHGAPVLRAACAA